MPHLFIFGYGYTAREVAKAAIKLGWQVTASVRDTTKSPFLIQDGVRPTVLPDVTNLGSASHILSSVPPETSRDPILRDYREAIIASPASWIGYLSTTGVYGDQQRQWVDETTPCQPTSQRGQQRFAAEQAWQALTPPAHIFRLSGIYGVGRNVLEDLKSGTARRIDKPNHLFNRIHVIDIAQTVMASMQLPNSGAIYNLADDLPASSRDVVEFAASLLGIKPPPLEDFSTATLSPMLQSFYSESKKVRNDRIKRELGITLQFPDYKAGLKALVEEC